MNEDLLLPILAAVRASAYALVLAIDGFFKEVEKQRVEEQSTRTTDDNGNCLHPQDSCTPAPAFGDPGRRYCRLCRCTVKGATQ